MGSWLALQILSLRDTMLKDYPKITTIVTYFVFIIILSGCSPDDNQDCLLGSILCEAKDQEVETDSPDNQTRIDRQKPIPQRQLFLDY